MRCDPEVMQVINHTLLTTPPHPIQSQESMLELWSHRDEERWQGRKKVVWDSGKRRFWTRKNLEGVRMVCAKLGNEGREGGDQEVGRELLG
jgi:hypothetical protein